MTRRDKKSKDVHSKPFRLSYLCKRQERNDPDDSQVPTKLEFPYDKAGVSLRLTHTFLRTDQDKSIPKEPRHQKAFFDIIAYTNILMSNNTTGRFFIPPVVFINSGIVLLNSIIVFVVYKRLKVDR